MSGRIFPKRGEIYWTNFEPAVGGETKKRRPGLIVSNNTGNEVSSVVMIAPITSKVKEVYPFEVKILLKGKPAKIMLNQCRAIDKSRLSEKMGEVNSATMHAVEQALRLVFAMN